LIIVEEDSNINNIEIGNDILVPKLLRLSKLASTNDKAKKLVKLSKLSKVIKEEANLEVILKNVLNQLVQEVSIR